MFASKSARNRCSDLRFVSCWPMFDSTRGLVRVVKRRCVRLDSLCARVARDRWHRAWPPLKRRSARSLQRISAKTRQNLAVGGLCGLSCFRPSFRIVLADVCGPECRQTSLCAVFKSTPLERYALFDSSKKHVLSPTRNATLNNFTLSF